MLRQSLGLITPRDVLLSYTERAIFHLLCYLSCKYFIMLYLHLYTFIIGHTYYNMLSILNDLTVQQKLKETFITHTVFLDKKVKAQQQQNNIPEPGIEPGTSFPQTGCIAAAPSSQIQIQIQHICIAQIHVVSGNIHVRFTHTVTRKTLCTKLMS